MDELGILIIVSSFVLIAMIAIYQYKKHKFVGVVVGVVVPYIIGFASGVTVDRCDNMMKEKQDQIEVSIHGMLK